MYQGSAPGRFVESQSSAPPFLPEDQIYRSGKVSSELAKIAGSRHREFTRRGKICHLPAHHFTSIHALCILHRNAPLPAFTKTMTPTTATIRAIKNDQCQTSERTPLSGLEFVKQVRRLARGSPTTIPANIISDIPITDAALVILSPSHMMTRRAAWSARIVIGRNQYRGCNQRLIPRAARALQRLAIEKRLHDAQQNRQVARVLRNLAPAELAFLLQALQVRPYNRHQLQDDRRRNVRHDAQRKIVRRENCTLEEVDNPRTDPAF